MPVARVGSRLPPRVSRLCSFVGRFDEVWQTDGGAGSDGDEQEPLASVPTGRLARVDLGQAGLALERLPFVLPNKEVVGRACGPLEREERREIRSGIEGSRLAGAAVKHDRHGS